MIRALHVDTEKRWGGGENQLMMLARGMLQRDHETAIAAHPESRLASEARAAGIHLFDLKVSGDADVPAARKLRRIIRDYKPDIIHMHTAHAHGVGAMACVGMRGLLRIVSRRVPFPISRNPASLLKYRKGADAYVAVCEPARDELLAAGVDKERITVVNSGIDVDSVSSAEPAADMPFGQDTIAVGTVGALVEIKAQNLFIEAAHLTLSEKPENDVHFAIAGEGPLRQELETQVGDLGMKDSFHFLGFRKDASAVTARFNVFVLTSKNEGIPNVVLEAMALSKPVVAFAAGGVQEIVLDGKTGILVPQGDVDTLARSIRDLIADSDRREEMGRNGLARVREEFSCERMIESTISIYISSIKGFE